MFLNKEEIERQTRIYSLKEAWGTVETAFLLNVPFYWPPVEINGALDALGLDPTQSVAIEVGMLAGM